MHVSGIAALAVLAATAIAAPTPSTEHIVHERRSLVSSAWVKRDRVHGDVKLPMRIGLIQSNLEKGPDYLMEVSDPKSNKYGKHFSVDEVTDMFAPSQGRVDSVRAWLESSGIEAERVSQSVNKQWLQFDAKASEVEELLKAKYHFYESEGLDKASIACDE